MDLMSETMDAELKNCLRQSGVKEDVLASLEDDELHTVEHLEATSDQLLKQCGIKVGQIIRLRDGVKRFKDQQKECELSGVYPIPTSSPASSPLPINTLSPSLSSPLRPQVAMRSTPKSNQMTTSSPCPNSPNEIENKMPNFEKSPNVSCFGSESEPIKNDGKWLQKYELPTKFSPRVSQALKENKMCSSERNDFTRDITTSIMTYTLYPTKVEREHVAFLIIKKYPFLADKLGSGIGSWEQAIKNRLKNRRKNKPQAIKRPSTKQDESTKPKKVQKLSNHGRIPEKPQGETVETCREHASQLKKEMMKTSNRNVCMIRELMELSFAFRRERILIDPRPIGDVMKEYPALTLVSEFKSEFGRVMDDKTLVKTMANTFTCTLAPKVISLAKRRGLNLTKQSSSLLEEMEEAISNDTAKKSDIQDTAAVLLLPLIMGSKGNASLLKICSDDESIDGVISGSVAPQLVGGGEVGDVTPLYLVAEKNVVVKINSGISMSTALALLMGCYYIFNIEYPTNLKNVFVMLEATTMDRPNEARKRVVINKFLQELDIEH